MQTTHLSEELVLSIIAKTAHQVDRALMIELSEKVDPAAALPPSWDELTPSFQASCVANVVEVLNNGKSAEAAHESWRAQRTAEGWIYNRFQSDELKMHPYLVPWKSLPQLQRMRCGIFAAIVGALTDPVMPPTPGGAERAHVGEELPPAA